MMNSMIFIGGAAILGLILISFIGMAIARLWRRATPETALVRTGSGKELVVINGGCLQIPVIHTITPVNMATMRLDIRRDGERSLITKDRLRVDAEVAFFTRVIRSSDGVSKAASSLGNRTENPDEIRKLIESKFDDVIRAVAMNMTLDGLLDNRDEFRKLVLEGVKIDLEKNGLELEAVSVTTLNQTALAHFKDDNVIDAVGKTLITQKTEARRKERNDITQDTEVAIAKRNLEAAQQKFEIQQSEAKARLEQEEKVANMTAEQQANVKAAAAMREREAREAEIASQRGVAEAEIQRQEAVEIAEQIRQINVAKKSEEQSAAQAKANGALADAKRAEESVITATDVARADRAKRVAVIAAEQKAEVEAVQVRVTAQAERAAAEDRAEAVRTEAAAGAEAAESEARGIRAKLLAEADGQQKINEAENALTPEIIALRQALAAIQQLPAILTAQAAPLAAIKDFKVVAFPHGGAGPSVNGSSGAGAPGAPAGGMAHQVMDALLQFRTMAPLVDNMLKEAGLTVGPGGQVEAPGMIKAANTPDAKPASEAASPEAA